MRQLMLMQLMVSYNVNIVKQFDYCRAVLLPLRMLSADGEMPRYDY